ncbi:hypothetical protein BJ742DRAFT_858085 [Cladochytrium replicatum]|nr:hypothetical protein BJ742DRAFT_858085 [Cladochytrium replicatum]
MPPVPVKLVPESTDVVDLWLWSESDEIPVVRVAKGLTLDGAAGFASQWFETEPSVVISWIPVKNTRTITGGRRSSRGSVPIGITSSSISQRHHAFSTQGGNRPRSRSANAAVDLPACELVKDREVSFRVVAYPSESLEQPVALSIESLIGTPDGTDSWDPRHPASSFSWHWCFPFASNYLDARRLAPRRSDDSDTTGRDENSAPGDGIGEGARPPNTNYGETPPWLIPVIVSGVGLVVIGLAIYFYIKRRQLMGDERRYAKGKYMADVYESQILYVTTGEGVDPGNGAAGLTNEARPEEQRAVDKWLGRGLTILTYQPNKALAAGPASPKSPTRASTKTSRRSFWGKKPAEKYEDENGDTTSFSDTASTVSTATTNTTAVTSSNGQQLHAFAPATQEERLKRHPRDLLSPPPRGSGGASAWRPPALAGTLYRVTFDYIPIHADELALSRGERVAILEFFEDGWCRGKKVLTDSETNLASITPSSARPRKESRPKSVNGESTKDGNGGGLDDTAFVPESDSSGTFPIFCVTPVVYVRREKVEAPSESNSRRTSMLSRKSQESKKGRSSEDSNGGALSSWLSQTANSEKLKKMFSGGAEKDKNDASAGLKEGQQPPKPVEIRMGNGSVLGYGGKGWESSAATSS